ncbi:uncharacterized protein LOC121266098 isoform X2 [Juglans microcarpa x Juglans regia]|uniref:uncharacterized protein LOC121266098 isoform X2 n=1 Tax=Juglans microcarpa x Juglans regia TaxID=2249226 RepID=UPI001B7DDDDF|nr:uncharacterized protein LOC121266098 isoform X2 [Juglans microcarpa x Juglans regia]
MSLLVPATIHLAPYCTFFGGFLFGSSLGCKFYVCGCATPGSGLLLGGEASWVQKLLLGFFQNQALPIKCCWWLFGCNNIIAPGRWCEGEKAFPPKKRRSTFERRANEDAIMEKDKKMIKTKMKTKMNKKCAQQYDEGEEKETKEAPENTSAKKRGRGGALMEGSRCSRVNGRGWRCCQQTLVGYSLCEHHLGKGRLRSMASVRSRSLAGNNTAPKMDHESEPVLSAPSSSLQENKPKDSVSDNDGDDDGHEDEKKPLMVTKKRMKLGMVKARSISSLLGETNNGHNVMADNHHDQ